MKYYLINSNNDNMKFSFKNCLPSCLFNNHKQNHNNSILPKLNIELTNQNNNINENNKPLSPTNRFKNLVNSVISLGSFKNSKNKLNNDNYCKICNKEFINENKSCDCLAKDELHPNNKETKVKIYEKYINNKDVIHQAIHIDKNPEQLAILISDIYDIVEKSTLKEDLTPKTLEKVEENLINEICVHIEDYIKNEE